MYIRKKYDMHKNYLRSIFLRLHVGRCAFALYNMSGRLGPFICSDENTCLL